MGQSSDAVSISGSWTSLATGSSRISLVNSSTADSNALLVLIHRSRLRRGVITNRSRVAPAGPGPIRRAVASVRLDARRRSARFGMSRLEPGRVPLEH